MNRRNWFFSVLVVLVIVYCDVSRRAFAASDHNQVGDEYGALLADVGLLKGHIGHLEQMDNILSKIQALGDRCFHLMPQWLDEFILLTNEHQEWNQNFNHQIKSFQDQYKDPVSKEQYLQLQQQILLLTKSIKTDLQLDKQSFAYIQDVRDVIKCFAEFDAVLELAQHSAIELYNISSFSKDFLKQTHQMLLDLQDKFGKMYDTITSHIQSRSNLISAIQGRWDSRLSKLAAQFHLQEVHLDQLQLAQSFQSINILTDIDAELVGMEFEIYYLDQHLFSPITAIRKERIKPLYFARLRNRVAQSQAPADLKEKVEKTIQSHEKAHHYSMDLLQQALQDKDLYHQNRIRYVENSKWKESVDRSNCQYLVEKVKQDHVSILSEEAFQRFVQKCVD